MVVVVGFGPGGLSAASELARRGEEVVVIERRGSQIFHPCGIPAVLKGLVHPRKLLTPAPMMRGVKVEKDTAIRVTEEGVECGKGFRPGKVIIATGSEPVKMEGAVTVADPDSVEQVMEKLKEGKKRVAVIGAGAIGVEIACAVKEHDTLLFEAKERILPDIFSESFSSYIMEFLEAEGVMVKTGVAIEDAKSIDADLKISCIGFKPRFPEVGAKSDKFGLLTDERLRVILDGKPSERIFAVGDCIRPPGFENGYLPRLATAAYVQGKIAARNITGDNLIYRSFMPPIIIKIMDMEAGRLGEIGGPETEEIRMKLRDMPSWLSESQSIVALTVSREGKIVGVQVISHKHGEARYIINMFYLVIKFGISLDELRFTELCYQPEICEFPDTVKNALEVLELRLRKM